MGVELTVDCSRLRVLTSGSTLSSLRSKAYGLGFRVFWGGLGFRLLGVGLKALRLTVDPD